MGCAGVFFDHDISLRVQNQLCKLDCLSYSVPWGNYPASHHDEWNFYCEHTLYDLTETRNSMCILREELIMTVAWMNKKSANHSYVSIISVYYSLPVGQPEVVLFLDWISVHRN